MPNLTEVCEKYYTYNCQDSTDSCNNVVVNLAKVKISVKGQPTWRTQSDPTVQPESAQRVTVQRKDTQSTSYGTVSTSKNFKWVTQVEIHSDVIKGLNNQMKLPLDPSLRDVLGESVAIDVSRTRSQTEPVVPVDIQTGQEFPQGASANVAEVRQERLDYSGQFECTAMLKGRVLFPNPDGVTEINLIEVVHYLRENRHDDVLGGLQVSPDGKGVLMKLMGKITFRGDNESISWK